MITANAVKYWRENVLLGASLLLRRILIFFFLTDGSLFVSVYTMTRDFDFSVVCAGPFWMAQNRV
jgi:hypothetical protein